MTAIEAPAASVSRPGSAEVALYEHLGAAERYLHRTRDEALLALLRRHGCARLGELRILELGCGEGSLLRSLLHYGADEGRLDGIDLASAAVRQARAALPGARLSVADAAALPYRTGIFDLALAFTAFSSICHREARRRTAAEALRVLRPGGLLVVYDFWVNPLNRQVRPLRAGELRALFAPRPAEMESVTLAPPIVRALGGRPALCRPLERLPFLHSHLLAAVVKEG